jgi:putative GTP pyrophosphokinase
MASPSPSSNEPLELSIEAFRQQYAKCRSDYERLAINLQQALKTFLDKRQVPYLDVLYRIKDSDSAYEKATRKGYLDPFAAIEDWCGIRIICYYPSDVDQICTIIREELDVQTQEDTANRLASHEFGYRSTHLVLTVKESWMATPNYRGLEKLKAEVQVRTILMHAWAEVEHKLQYKSAEQVPDQFRRKLYRLSAKFEEADEQFEELRIGIAHYRKSIKEKATTPLDFRNQELNLDTLVAFLNAAFPDRIRANDSEYSVYSAGIILQELTDCGMDMKDVVDTYELAKDTLKPREEAVFGPASTSTFAQSGAFRSIMEAGSDVYYNHRLSQEGGFYSTKLQPVWIESIEAARASIRKPSN